MIEVVCTVDHSPEGTEAGAVICTFPNEANEATRRMIASQYPNCVIEYREVEAI